MKGIEIYLRITYLPHLKNPCMLVTFLLPLFIQTLSAAIQSFRRPYATNADSKGDYLCTPISAGDIQLHTRVHTKKYL